MPTKAFLHKKSLLDQFKDDYKSTGYIQSARAEHTWNNPLTRRKRTNKLNGWIKSFQGKRHIHKLARFNAQQAGKNEDASSNLYVAYHISPTKFEKFRLMPKSGMGTTFYGRGIYLTYDKSVIDHYKNLMADYYDNLYVYTVLISPKAKIISEDEIFDYIDDSVDLEDSERVADLLKNKVDGIRYYNDEDGNSVVIFDADLVSIKSRQEYSMKNEAMSLKGFLSNIGDKLVNKYGLDKNKVQNYLGSHTQEMQELLDDKELSLKEKVLFVRSEITGEKDESKQSESLVLPNPTIIYRGPIEDVKKACSYVSKILADKGLGLGRVAWQAPKDGEYHYGHPEKDMYTVILRGSNNLIKDSFAVYKDVFGNDFWNNCDADPRGWVDPLTINRYDVATPRQESKKHEFYMDDDESEDYYYCQRCGRVTPSYELDAHGGFCSDCDARWTAEHENESKDTDEKLGYEKGHKNSKGENAPWVIRSHEDNRVLASFANEDDAKEHLKRMKQYSKQEAYVDNSDTAQKDYVERVISAVQDYYGYSLFDAKNLVQRNAKKVKDWYMSGEVSDVEAARCLGGKCEPTKKESKDQMQRMKQYSKQESTSANELDKYIKDAKSLLKSKYGMDFNDKDTCRLNGGWMEKLDAMFYQGKPVEDGAKEVAAFCGYNKDESKKSESATTEEDAIRKAFKSIVEHVPANVKKHFGEEFVNENMEALLDLFNGWFEFDDGEFVTTVRVVDPDNEHGDCYDEDDEAYQWNACYGVTEGIIDLLDWNYGKETVKQPIQDALFYNFIGTKYIDKSNESKTSKKFESATADVEKAFSDAAETCGVADQITISTDGNKVYCVMEMDEDKYGLDHYKWSFDTKANTLEWHGDESTKGVGARKQFDNMDDLISWIISDIKALFKTHRDENKLGEGFSLELIDTIQVPEWLWKAHILDDTTDLEEDEIEKLNNFREKYKNYHLDDKSDDPYFSSRNDFDELGGNVYDVDVYKMSDKPTEKKNESIKDFPTNTGYKFTFGFHSPKTVNVAMNVAKEKGYACEQDKYYNNMSIWVKEPQDAIRFADAIVNVANGENGVSLERSDVDKAFALAVKNNVGYKENKDAIDTAASQYALSIRPTESFDGLFILGELTNVVDFLEEIK